MAKTARTDRLKAQRRIAPELSTIVYARPGPDAYWTRKVQSTSKTRVLTEKQLAEYQEWLDNARRLKTLVAELYELTAGIVDEDPRSPRADRKRAATSRRAPKRSARRTSR